MSVNNLKIEEGSLHLLVAFDLGFEIRLSQLPVLFGTRMRDPVRYNFLNRASSRDPQPVRIKFDSVNFSFGGEWKKEFQVFGTFFDLGALSLEFIAPLSENFEKLPELSASIHSNKDFLTAAKKIAESILETARPAVVNADFFSSPSVFSVVNIQRLSQATNFQSIQSNLGPVIAKILRLSDEPIGTSEIMRTLSPNVTYSDDDVVFASSRAAVIFDETSSEVIDIIELANVQALELSFIDGRLDRTIQSLYEEPNQGEGFWSRFTSLSDRLTKRLHMTSLDSTILVDRVEQMFKFATDSYLVQIHELCVQKMFLKSFSSAIDRKLQTIRDVTNDRRSLSSTSRMEFLEWIIIILIAIGTAPSIWQIVADWLN